MKIRHKFLFSFLLILAMMLSTPVTSLAGVENVGGHKNDVSSYERIKNHAKYIENYNAENLVTYKFSKGSTIVHGMAEKELLNGISNTVIIGHESGIKKYPYGDKYIIYKDAFKFDGESYDIKISVLESKVNSDLCDDNYALFDKETLEFGTFARNRFGVYDKNITEGGGYITCKMEILNKNGEITKLPINIGLTDLDSTPKSIFNDSKNLNYLGETIKIHGFTANPSNTIISSEDPEIGISKDGTLMGVSYSLTGASAKPFTKDWWNRSAIVKPESFRTTGSMTYTLDQYAVRTGNYIIITATPLKATYKIDNLIAGTLSSPSENGYEYYKIKGSDYTSKNSYKAKYWTADRNVLMGSKVIKKGSHIELKDLKNIQLLDNTNFTVHTTRKGKLKINKTN